MKPVDQTTFGVPGGNCFSACVASLLHLSIDEVPYFMGAEDWFAYFEEWLQTRNHYPLCFHLHRYTPRGLHILSGLSPRGPHSVVARGTEIVHDPHPSRAGLLERGDAIVLIPLDPGHAAEKIACLADELAEAQHWRHVHEVAWRREVAAHTTLQYLLAHQNGGSFVVFDIPAAEAHAVSAMRLGTTRLDGCGATRYTLEPADAEVSCPPR